MAQTTQCPSCKTAFRVVNDQLKIRGGLVRCGACNIVFNAREHLLPEVVREAVREDAHETVMPRDAAATPPSFDPDELIGEPEAPAEAEPAPETMPEPAPKAEPETEPGSDTSTPAPATLAEEMEARASARTDPDTTPAEPFEAAETIAAPADAEAAEPAPDDTGASEVPDPAGAPEINPPSRPQAAPDAAPNEEVLEEPGFVKQARRMHKVRRVMRLVMCFGSALLFITLLGQGAYAFRNQLAASFPPMKPYLAKGCALLDCQVGLLTQIDALSIESSELQQSATQNNALVLNILLRNRSGFDQVWPNLELALNDANEKTIVRRVFLPAEYMQPPLLNQGFGATSEQSIKLVFEVAQLKPSGFALHVFYP